MFHIDSFDFNSTLIEQLHEHHLAIDNWPMVYVLVCPKTKLAYVGETADLVRRMESHLSHDKKRQLEKVYLISGASFNKSITYDLEARLIKYLAADGKYQLMNANIGMANHNYQGKLDFGEKTFPLIWEKLREHGIASQTLEYIANLDLFKYSPYKSLTTDQYKSIAEILKSLIRNDKSTNLVLGGAGTGKTILAIFLIKLLCTPADNINLADFLRVEPDLFLLIQEVKRKYPNPKVALAIPVSAFRETIRKVFSQTNGLTGKMVIGPAELSRQRFDIVFVDESHRLRKRKNIGSYFRHFDSACERLKLDPEKATELQWAELQADKRILFYDRKQSVRPSDVDEKDFEMLKEQPTTSVCKLSSQMRLKGGKEYTNFVDDLLYKTNSAFDKKYKSKKYELLLFDSVSKMRDRIMQRESQTQLCRVMAGYAWPWESNKNPNGTDIIIGEEELRWNSTVTDWINSSQALDEVGCIHTVQGYDLNYAAVIFGNDIGYDEMQQKIIVRKENYHDAPGKAGTSDERLYSYILNIYSTLMQRGISGTYVYVCDPALKAYFSRRMPIFKG